MWALRGLRDGVLTTRWPARPDDYADATRGPAVPLDPAGPGAGLAALCPTGAISDDGGLRLDQGRCVQCGRCVAARPELFGWASGPGSAVLARAALVLPPESDAELDGVRAELARRTAALRRSVHLRHVDAGSDGAEEFEIVALLNPVYDIHRLGVFFTASPRHADVLLVTGAGSAGMAEPLRQTYTAMPHPKVVIAVGTDAVSGGLTGRGGVGELVPVDVWLPGSPPSPFSILHAVLLAVGRLAAARLAATPVTAAGPGDPR
jgi:Ni,Fe-hydrogenase III small subunit/ferredoxin